MDYAHSSEKIGGYSPPALLVTPVTDECSSLLEVYTHNAELVQMPSLGACTPLY